MDFIRKAAQAATTAAASAASYIWVCTGTKESKSDPSHLVTSIPFVDLCRGHKQLKMTHLRIRQHMDIHMTEEATPIQPKGKLPPSLVLVQF
jgi:hypothetical protein